MKIKSVLVTIIAVLTLFMVAISANAGGDEHENRHQGVGSHWFSIHGYNNHDYYNNYNYYNDHDYYNDHSYYNNYNNGYYGYNGYRGYIPFFSLSLGLLRNYDDDDW